MKRSMLLIGMLFALCGCEGSILPQREAEAYHAVLTWPGASPREMDDVIRGRIQSLDSITLQRAVAESGRLDVYLQSSDSLNAVKSALAAATADLPAEAAVESVTPRKGALPPAPEAVSERAFVIKIDAEKCARLGVSVDEATEIAHSLQSRDPGVVGGATLQTESGAEVQLKDVATIGFEHAPQRIVREY